MLEKLKHLPWPKILPPAVAAAALVVVALAANRLGGWSVLARNPLFWVAVCLVVAAAVFAGAKWGLPWVQERLFVRKEGSEYLAAGQQSPQEMRAKFARALHTLRGLPQLRGRADPLYALPWFLLVGEGGSGKTALLQEAEVFSALLPTPGAGTPTQNFDLWVSNHAVVLDTAGRYTFPVDVARDRAEWYRLLKLLAHHREGLPLNGLAIAVGADALAGRSEEKLRSEASKMRERIEEAIRELGADLPLYLVVTKCDLVDGFSTFFSLLPERVGGEAVGWVDDPPPIAKTGTEALRGAQALQRLASGLDAICDRLRMLRLAILDGGKAREESKPAVFCFPEEMRALARPLAAFAEPLANEDVRYHTPLLRGVFFASARQQGTPFSLVGRQLGLPEDTLPAEEGSQRWFLRDLFNVALPKDRGLATTTARAVRKRGLRIGLRSILLAAAGAILAVYLVRGFVHDRRIVASVDPSACPEVAAKAGPSPRLVEADACRKTVQELSERNAARPRWLVLGFSRGLRLEEALRRRYVEKYRAEVLAPLNAVIDRTFPGTSDPLPLMLVVARRIRIAGRCLSAAGCPDPTSEVGWPDTSLMLDPAGGRRLSQQDAARARDTYVAYVAWQGDPGQQGLEQDMGEDRGRLQRWLAARQFTPERLYEWVNRRSPPLGYETYWELPAPIGTSASPRVEAACTRKHWEEDIAPFLQQIQDAVPDVGEDLARFDAEYHAGCFAQWQRFLAGFAQGAERWKGADRRRALGLKLLSKESPFERVIDDSVANLEPWIPGEADVGIQGAAAGAPAWAMELSGYAGSEQRKAVRDAFKKIETQIERASWPEASLKLAQAAFAEGKASEDSESPVLKAWWIASQATPAVAPATAPAGGGGVAVPLPPPLPPEAALLGSLVLGPVRYVWRVVLDEVGGHLEKKWAENVIAPLRALAPAERVPQLYGPGGRVAAFVEQYVRPFVAGEEARPVLVLGEGVPLSPRFFKVLADARQLKPVLEGGGGPYPVRIRGGRPTEIEGGGSALVEGETVLTIACAAKSYRVSSRPRDPSEAEASVLWTLQGCSDVAITVYFAERGIGAAPAGDGGGRIQLTRRQPGPSGFLALLQQFSDGSQRFTIDEFAGADPEAARVSRHGVRALNVHYRVEVPSTLAKLVGALQESGPPGGITSASPTMPVI